MPAKKTENTDEEIVEEKPKKAKAVKAEDVCPTCQGRKVIRGGRFPCPNCK